MAKARHPVSDHCDGVRFFNPGPSAPRGVADLLRWRMTDRRVRWPRDVAGPSYPPPPATVAPGMTTISFIGHASFLLQLDTLAILTDPVFSARCSPVRWAGPRRVRPPGLTLDALPRIDAVLLSHNHYDHMDLPSLRRLQARDNPVIVTPLGNGALLARAGLASVRELDWWQPTRLQSVEITATPARHFSRRGMLDQNRALWAGFMIRAGSGQILFAGDSGAGPHWATIRNRLGSPGVALLPIGAYEPRWFMAPVHMNPQEAVDAHVSLGARRSIGMHFGTFQLTEEAIDAPEQALNQARNAAGVAEAFTTLGCGQTAELPL